MDEIYFERFTKEEIIMFLTDPFGSYHIGELKLIASTILGVSQRDIGCDDDIKAAQKEIRITTA